MLVLRKEIGKYLLVSFLAFVSCQTEVEEQKTNVQSSIKKDSPLTSYLQRIAMVETVEDNVIDKSSYCTIKLPYTVTVNNVTIAINTTADYAKVINNINAYTNDADDVKIIFPVTMIYYDHEEDLIQNESEFNTLLAFWQSLPDLLSKINCLDINYPIVINVYNSVNQISNSITILNDESLFNFINGLNNNQLFAISYPISVKDGDNHFTTITNNSQLDDAIKEAIEHCSTNVNSSLNFIEIITAGSWKISYYYDESDETSVYNGFQFVFKKDYTVTAVKNGITLNGTWETKIENSAREFKIHFDSNTNNLLHELDEGWKLFEFNNSQIRFRENTSDGGLQADYLYLSKL